MPQLNDNQVRLLLDILNKTEETELTCDDCLPLLAEWAERELAGDDPQAAGPSSTQPPETVRLIAAHLDICPECVEELDALREAIRALATE